MQARATLNLGFVAALLITPALHAAPQGSWSDQFDRPGLLGRVFALGEYQGQLVAGGLGGHLCAGGALVRLVSPTMATGNQAVLPQPVQTLDTGAAAGATRRYQYWFRTPGGPCGQMANLSNGYEIVWLP